MSLQLQAELEEVFDGAVASPTSRWVAANWISRVLLATPSVQPIYWEPNLTKVPVWGKCRPIPGLPDQTGYDGVEVFAGHAILWKGSTIKGSDLNDFSNWIPIGITASVGRATLATEFQQPAEGQTSPFVFLSGVSGTFTEGQFVRIVSNEGDASKIAYSYYTVDSVSESKTSVPSIDSVQGVPARSYARLYTSGKISWTAGGKVAVDGDTTDLVVNGVSRNVSASYTLLGQSTTVPATGASVQLPLTSLPSDLRSGDVVSVSTTGGYGKDLYKVLSAGQTLVCERLGVGSSQAASGTYYNGAASTVYVVFQPYVEVTNSTDFPVSVMSGGEMSPADGLKLVCLGYSGGVPTSDVVPAGSTVETLGVNEATEIENVGSDVNGDIYGVVALADYAYILKRDSIQSMQYIGGVSPYVIRAEIQDEGPVGRYAWCRFDSTSLVFWGKKGWMRYTGGQVVDQVGMAHWYSVSDEFDVSRADEIVAFHNRNQNEVWFAYPVLTGGTKVVIYNYESQSVVVDKYSSDINGITALGEVEWEVAPTWESLQDTECFDCAVRGSGVVAGSVPDLPDKRWYEYTDDGLRPRVLIGIGGTAGNIDNGENPDDTVPRILCHGRVWHRAIGDDCDPDAYTSSAETPDFDFGDPQTVKYIDQVYLHMNVPAHRTRPMKMKVQLGCKSALDSDIVWSAPVPVEVSGNGNVVTKADVRGAGRLVRLRFLSDSEDVQWEVSQYVISARQGGVY